MQYQYFNDEEFIRAIMMTTSRLELLANRHILDGLGLSMAATGLLILLKKHGTYSPTEIKNIIGSSKSNITQRLQSLSKKGLIEKDKDSAQTDGRIIKFKLTARGQEAADTILKKLAKSELDTSKFFTAQELAGHIAFFRKLNALIDDCFTKNYQ